MENTEIDQIILTFLEGEATANEIEILRKWLSENKNNQAAFESVKLYWESSTPGVEYPDLDRAYTRMKSLHRQEPDENVIPINTTKTNNRFGWFKIAAVFLVLILFSVVTYNVVVQKPVNPPVAVIQKIVKQNPKGQKLTTYLPDGSTVILNSLSKITYDRRFNGKERIVELEGEAFFQVKKDSTKAFKVITNGTTTMALGTSFNVNSKNRDFVEVALVTGKVQVSNKDHKSVILYPGNYVAAGKNGKMQVLEFDYLDKIGWKDGVLTFKNNSLSEITTKLENWYGVKFAVQDKYLNKFDYTANYKNKSLEEVMNGIAYVLHFEFEIEQETVKIKF
ncbi:FecR domain-containing protein [Reichenbachiella sp. MALMAid0571]|uniref:FecR family protein n=1 Tax=Reichenbachiella sp. MALMAid0571 TaxID=3143939 RepID=UPI0032DF4640